MPFKIQSCDCGEILINIDEAKVKLPDKEFMKNMAIQNLKEGEKYCQNCDKVIKVDGK